MIKMIKKVSVFSHSKEVAQDMMCELFNKSGENLVKCTPDYIETETTIYRSYNASESQRGSRSHELHIDKYTDPEIVQLVILPTLTRYCDGSRKCDCSMSDYIHYF